MEEILFSTEKQSQLVKVQDDRLRDQLTGIESHLDSIKQQLIINPPVKVFNRPSTSPRAVGFFSNDVTEYKYANSFIPARPVPEPMYELMRLVNHMLGTSFNGVLVNWYRDGNDHIGMHSDNEKELDPNTGQVAMVAFGALRELKFEQQQAPFTTHKVVLEPGFLYSMRGKSFQHEFKHGIMKRTKIKQERISFTFRCHVAGVTGKKRKRV